MYLIILLFSIWQSILFFGKNLGISVLLFILPFIIFLIKFLEKQDKIKNKKAKIIAIPIILLSSTYFIFNNRLLNDLNTVVIPGLVILTVMELIIEKFTLEKIINNMLNFIMKPIGYFGTVGSKIIRKISKKQKNYSRIPKNFTRIIKAILVSIPILIVVLVLLVTADSDFSKIFINIMNFISDILNRIKLSDITVRITTIALAFFYMAGFIENIINTKDIVRNNKEVKQKDNLTIKMLLTILNLVYLVFSIVQIKSLFTIYTMNKSNINYSYYARQGFFQLMVVSAINLITILMSKRDCYKKEKYIKIMDLIMIALTSVILLSSFIRMVLYEKTYGLTLLRVLVFCAQITEGILLIPTTLYVIDKKINLAKSYFLTIVTMYVILNFANINRIIAKVNVNMYLERKNISGSDIYYLTQLGTDAVPETVRLLDIVGEEEQKYVNILEQIEQATKGPVDDYLYKEIYNNNYIDKNKKFLINNLNEMYNELNNKKTTWQEFNTSKYKAKIIIEEKLTVK